MGALVLVTPPSGEVISVADAKIHLRVDTTADDGLIGDLITAARERLDGKKGFLGRALLTQTWDYMLDEFPISGGQRFPDAIRLPLAPVQSVTYVRYVDTNGVTQTMASGDYQVDIANTPARIVPAYGAWWPVARLQPNSLTVRFVAGYGTASDVPRLIARAMLATIAFWYENRDQVNGQVPAVLDDVLLGLKVNW